jgi:outer membrane receptor protein involved in Fe transport
MRTLMLLFPALLATTDAWTEDHGANTGSGEQPLLEEVVVEASRAGLNALEIPVNTSILSRTDVWEFATKTTDEILRQVPGFNLLRAADSIASAPVTTTVSLRGLGGTAASRTLVLLDGIPMHSPISSEVYWARIPKHRINHIEVVRGGGANAWGNLSLGGVINIITDDPREDGLDFTGILSYPKTVDFALSGSQLTESWQLSADISHYDTDGYFNSPRDERTPIDERVSKKYDTVYGKAAYNIRDGVNVFFTGSLLDETRHGGTPKDVDDTEIWTIGTGLKADTADGSQWRANLFYEEMEDRDISTRVSRSGEQETITRLRLQPTSATGAGLVWSKMLGDSHNFTAGVDYRWTDLTIDDYGRYLEGAPTNLRTTAATQDMGGAFVQDTWMLGPRWQLNGSLRFDYVTNQAKAVSVDLASGEPAAGEVYDRNSETTVNPSVGLRYQIGDNASFRAAAYKGFRAPTLRELYRSNSTRFGVVVVNNPYLEPERLIGVEGGIDWRLSGNSLLRLTVFQNVVKDLIQNVTRGASGDEPAFVEPCGQLDPGQTCRELDNLGEMESTGLELEAKYQAGENWEFFLSYLYNDAEITKEPENPDIVGNQVRQVPKHSGTVKIRNSNEWFDATFTARYVGERFEDELNSLPAEDFLLFDLNVSRQMTESLQVFLSVENLFDETYEIRTTAAGATEIGRPRFIGLGLRYRH